MDLWLAYTDLMTLWGAAYASKLICSVLEETAKKFIEDKSLTFLKDYFGKQPDKAHQDLLVKAWGKALRGLLQPFQDELESNGMTEEQAESFIPHIINFIDTMEVKRAICSAFTEPNSDVDVASLALGWKTLSSAPDLPANFSWSYVAERFSYSVSNLRKQDKELRDILKAEAAEKIADATRRIAGPRPEFNLEDYRESLLELHGNLKLELLDATGASYKVKLWDVYVPHTVRDCQDYIPQWFEMPKEHQQRLQQEREFEAALFDLSEESIKQRQHNYLNQSPRSVLEVLSDDHISHLVILGDPGSGKSTLLKTMLLKWARIEDVTARYAHPLPLLIELKEYGPWLCPIGKGFVRYLQDYQTVHRLDQIRLDELLQHKGGAILLLDGVDEILDSHQRKAAINDIHRFSNEYPLTRIVVTSRVIGYDQRQLADAGFRHFMLQDLDDTQIAEFLRHWYDTFPDLQDREEKRERLARAISERPRIHILAKNPLLLTLMSILNLSQVLPQDRPKLYERASEILLHHWDFERLKLKGAVELREKEEMLRRLANYMQNGAGNFIAGENLIQIFRDYLNELNLPNAHQEANALVDQLRNRYFMLCHLGADNFAFVHRAFLEFFCASALVRQAQSEPSLLEFLKMEVFGRHWQDEAWHEVLLLIAAMVGYVSTNNLARIIEHLLTLPNEGFESQNIFLAANCYLEARNPAKLKDSHDLIILELLKLLQLNLIGGQDVVVTVEHNKHISKESEAYLYAMGFQEDPVEWLKTYASQNGDQSMSKKAMQVLARYWKDNPETLSWLKGHAIESDSEWMRETAIEELTQVWPNDLGTFHALKDRSLNDESESVRQLAVTICKTHQDVGS